MSKPSRRPAGARVAALLGLGGLAALTACTRTQVDRTSEIVAQVLDRIDRLNSVCVAERIQVSEAGGNLIFTPVLRNPREAVSGPLRLRMTLSWPGEERTTRAPYVQLPAETTYPAGADYVVADPAGSITVRSMPGTTYIANVRVWTSVLSPPDSEDPDAVCHIREFDHSK